VSKDYIIGGTFEHVIHVWDRHTFAHVQALVGEPWRADARTTWCGLSTAMWRAGHNGIVYGLAVMATDGQERLVSASCDKSVRVSASSNESD
jgi:hypothetical protein